MAEKIEAPEAFPVDAAPRMQPDVNTFDVIGAGAEQERIESDYWFLTQREQAGYHDKANAVAADLGFEVDPGQSTGNSPMGAMSMEAFGYETRRMDTLRRAREANPEAFKGVPVTQEEIMADINGRLKSEWEDAGRTLQNAPDGFWSRSVPEFIGRMGPAATDEVGLPLALATVGVGTAANLGRLMLVEGGLSVIGEGATLPKRIDMADRLDIDAPNVPLQLAFAATVGAAIPLGIRGAQKGAGAAARGVVTTNRELVKKFRARASELTADQRAAVNAVEREIAEQDVGPAARGTDQAATTDAALDDIAAGRQPSEDIPAPDPAKVASLTTPRPAPKVEVAFDLGPRRPYAPDQPVIDVVASAVEDVLGPNARVVITSGQEGDLPQFGADRHITGDAADVRIIDGDGREINMADSPEVMEEISRAAARRGAKGIGFGAEYMDGRHMHIDLKDPDPAQGQANTWGTGGTAMREELVALMNGELTVPARAPALTLDQSLRNLLRDGEGAGYDTASDFTIIAPPARLSDMTLDEIDAWQMANQQAGAESTAAGGYQIIRDTMLGLREKMGLTGSEKFTTEVQDRMADALLEEAGLSRYQAGQIDADSFADNIAGVWAALPLADGRSRYAGDGLNAAQVGRDTVMDVLGGAPYQSAGRPPPTMTRFAASGINVDPRTYQFRSDVNAEGVGTSMSRVNEWDELLAGDFIVHERLDGTRFVADGHHRRDLANRLENEGHAPIELNGFILREADGYTVEHVRAIAAVKNIEAGNATAIDAAKVLRIDPAMLEKLTLRNSHARDARGLMRLSDEGFDMVTNRLVAEPHAAFVGELTSDGQMQDAILRTLVSAKPRNLAEARQIAQDAYRAGRAKQSDGAQVSLFGDDFDITETLFKERAEVLSKALAQLRNDKRVFATLVRERDRIKEAGNETADASNAARVNTDETALALIEKLVNRAGPLDDALNDAARTARSGTVAGGIRDFLATVRSTIEGGDIGRLLDGGDGRARDAATPDGRANEGAASRAGDGRAPDGPAGREAPSEAGRQGEGRASERTDAGDQTLIDGVAPVTERDRLEAAQGAPLRGGDAASDGGLFDLGARDQDDMFAPDPARASVGLGDAFDDPSPTSPAIAAQVDAADNELRRGLAEGADFFLPTGRIVDGEAEVISAEDILADLDADDNFMEILNVCKR